ncbi:MAG: AraC family ligand binding domain-containing protein, partial [Anaerovorax sp.]
MDRNFYDRISFLQKFKFENKIHGDISMKAVISLPIHMHDGAELLYVLEGSVRVKISFNYYDLSQGDFLLINTFEVHSVEKISEHNILLLLSCNDNIFGSKEYFFAFDPYFYRNFYKSKVEKVKKDMVKFYIEREENPDNPDKAVVLLNEIGDICIGYFQIQNFDPIHKSESPLLENPAKLNRIGNTF